MMGLGRRKGGVFIAGCCIAISTALPVAQAQDKTPDDFPGLQRYVDFVHEAIADDTRLYWLLLDGGIGRLPYLVYCTDLVQTGSDLRGKIVRTAPNSPARRYFTAATGEVVQLLAPAHLNQALEAGLIDCLGFGGDPASSEEMADLATPPPADQAIDEIKQRAAALGAEATDSTFVLREGVLDWMFYRAGAGDKYILEDLLMMYLAEGERTGREPLIHMAGYWAVRAYEMTAPGTHLRSKNARRAAGGDCDGRREFCKGIQIELKRMGKYAGAIDGIIGRGTQSAIASITNTRKTGDPNAMLSLNEFVDKSTSAAPAVAVANPPLQDGGPAAPSAASPGPDDFGPPETLDDF